MALLEKEDKSVTELLSPQYHEALEMGRHRCA